MRFNVLSEAEQKVFVRELRKVVLAMVLFLFGFLLISAAVLLTVKDHDLSTSERFLAGFVGGCFVIPSGVYLWRQRWWWMR